MIGTHFKTDAFRRYTSVFGSLFNDLTIKRYNGVVEVEEIPVPLFYGPSEKYIIAKNSNYSSLEESKLKALLPRISYSFVGLSHNPARQPLKNIILYNPTDGTQAYNRVPYDLIFELDIKSKFVEDAYQIVEQILPFFTPTLNVSMVDNGALGIVSDIRIRLDSVTPSDLYEGSLEESRVLTWNFNFTLEGWMYKPQSIQSIIKQVDLNIGDYTKDLVTIDADVNPLSADEDDQHTIDVTITNL